jgi:hypothetical protein
VEAEHSASRRKIDKELPQAISANGGKQIGIVSSVLLIEHTMEQTGRQYDRGHGASFKVIDLLVIGREQAHEI